MEQDIDIKTQINPHKRVIKTSDGAEGVSGHEFNDGARDTGGRKITKI